MERYISELYSNTTCFWIFSVENELSVIDCAFISTQKECVHVGKIVQNKDIVQLTQTSIKGRHSINADMNAESIKYGYFK